MESEYVCYPNPYVNCRVLSRNEMLMRVLVELVHPSESQLAHPWYQKRSADKHLGMIGYVANGFWQEKFDPKFDRWQPPQTRTAEWAKQRKLIAACVPLWVETWKVLVEMDSSGTLPTPPSMSAGAIYPLTEREALAPLWFMLLVLEGEFLTPWADYLPPDGASGFNALLKKQQNDHRKLQNIDSPFDNPCETFHTRLFIKSAIVTIGMFPPFLKDFYTPMIKQRQSVTALMKDVRYEAFDLDGKHRDGYGMSKKSKESEKRRKLRNG